MARSIVIKPTSVLLMAGLLSLAAVTGVVAQSHDGKGPRLGFWAVLDLTESQQVQITQLHERMGAQKEQFKARGERPSKAEVEALGAEYKQALAAILTSDQQAKLEEMKAAGKGRGPRRRGGFKAGPRLQALEKLDLSDEQWASIKELREERKAHMEQYKASGERPTKEEMQARREAMKQSFEAILTPDQLARLEEMKANVKGRSGRRPRLRERGFGLKGLDLSDDQKAQLKVLRQGMAEERKARRASGERPTREEMKAHHEAMQASIAHILTPEQRQQLEERRAARGAGGEKGAMRTTESAVTTGDAPPTVIESTSWGRIKAERK